MKYRLLPLFAVSVCFGTTYVATTSNDARWEYQRLARSGNCRAQTAFAELLNREGRLAEAMSWLESAASQGDVGSQVRLGDLYSKTDSARAVVWYERASASSSAEALWKLAQMYENGEGVREDGAIALALYTRAATLGYAAAQNSLGNLAMLKGDFGAALKWYRVAADGGSGEALLNLAGMYWQGLGVARDSRLARKWAASAAAMGVVNAAAFVEEMERGERP